MLDQKEKDETLTFCKATVIALETVKADLKEAETLEQAKKLVNETLLVAKLSIELYQNDSIQKEKLEALIKETLN